MINALKGLGQSQFELARWAPESYDRYKIIRVSVVSEREKQWSTAIQNIMTTAGSTLLKTSSVYPYEPRQHVKFRDEWYEIRNVGTITNDVAGQALALVNSGNSQYVLELVRANGYDTK